MTDHTADSALSAVQSASAQVRQMAAVDAALTETLREQAFRLGQASRDVFPYMPNPFINLYGGDRTEQWRVLLERIDVVGDRYVAVAMHQDGEVHDVVLPLAGFAGEKTVEGVRGTGVKHRYDFDGAVLTRRRPHLAVFSHAEMLDALIEAQEAAAREIARQSAAQAQRVAESEARTARIAALTGAPRAV